MLAPPIYVAAHQKHKVILRVLLNHNPEIEAVSDNNPKTALSAATWAKNAVATEESLAAGADPNRVSIEVTPLMHALSTGDVAILELLVMAGADVNMKAKTYGSLKEKTALAKACDGCSGTSIVKYLVKVGADAEGLVYENDYKYAKACLAR